ncbi:C4-dicarboxylate ABC transporter [Pueribacillus theae]|uniref:C4-dicarboxylate ABC transporter n=1 Tax=Pueribacillus theae TaxID=2171751 RepID=A0A2U1K0X5_9BACI|nr:TRAP transporter permease [Pueribacillus theae]PWA11052.1 C4-dicarboxylate ABC transporter [Pueribacillus theae]
MSKKEGTKNEQIDDVSVDEILEKYDRESTYRRNLGKWSWIVMFLAVSLTLFHLFTGYRGAFEARIQGPIHLGTALGLIFLLYPIKKGLQRKQKGVPWYDAILAIVALGVGYYNVIFYDELVSQKIVFGYTMMDYIVATLGVLLVLEAARRCVGLPIVFVAGAAILYALFGNHIPTKLFAHRGFSWEILSTDLYLTTKGIFSTPIQVSSTFIFLFLLFGVMLIRTGVGQFFNDLAFAITGRFTGGQAKAAVVASALQGMVSGSSVANTVGSGSFTIPMMKKAGYKPEFAAATEASASTGGQIMPPVMGAAAFIMATYTETPYSHIMIVAVIPAMLYFLGVFLGVHFESKKMGIVGFTKDSLPRMGQLMIERGYLILPLVVIFYTLVTGRTPMRAALIAILVSFLVSLVRKETRMSIKGIIHAFEEGARSALPVIAACAAAGIIVGVVVQTGLGGRIANGIIALGGGSLILTLVFTMIACLILGMGLPTTANYIVTATMAAPALILGLDVPVLAAHFFVFYFGIVADITPPVCLAAYAGAGLARANPFMSGVIATKLATAAYIIPFIFVLNPQMLLIDAEVWTVVFSVATSIVGMIGVSSGMMGYFIRKAYMWERVVLIIGGLGLITPNHIQDIIGVIMILAILLIQSRRPKDVIEKRKISMTL